jgi:hypothetical protein
MLRSIAAECECSCSHSRSALRCVSKHEGAHIGSSSSFETRARPFVLCGFSSACALLRMRTASRSVQLTMSNSPSRSRGAFSAPGVLHRCFAHPERGWAERRETFGCSAEHPWGVSCASKTRVNALMTRYARRLRGALRPMTRDARLSALHRGGFGLPGPRFRLLRRPPPCNGGHLPSGSAASSSQAGHSAWRATSRASRSKRLRAACHRTPLPAPPSGSPPETPLDERGCGAM